MSKLPPGTLSPVAFRVPLHYTRPAPNHESAGGLFRDCNRDRGAGQGERAADRKRFALHAVVRSWGLSGAVLLDPSLSGFTQNGHSQALIAAVQNAL